jgi:hypothetical protein
MARAQLYPYIGSFLSQCAASGPEHHDAAQFALSRLCRTMEFGADRDSRLRKGVPSIIEQEAVRNRSPVLVRVYFLDDSFLALPVESWMTFRCAGLARAIGLAT